MGKEKTSAEQVINTIRRKAKRKHSAEKKFRIVLGPLRGEVEQYRTFRAVKEEIAEYTFRKFLPLGSSQARTV